MHNPILVRALKKCNNEDAVEAVFIKFRKSDFSEKRRYLDICRGNPQTFFAGSVIDKNEKELESEYLTVRSMFLTGSWR